MTYPADDTIIADETGYASIMSKISINPPSFAARLSNSIFKFNEELIVLTMLRKSFSMAFLTKAFMECESSFK